MQDKNYRMSVVVDEYGGTAGIVSLSRLVEEIVGEVGDELAAVEKDYEVIDEHTYIDEWGTTWQRGARRSVHAGERPLRAH